jgi:hypothetical protein
MNRWVDMVAMVGLVVGIHPVAAQDLGYGRLREEWGERTPTGAGIRATQVEAEEAPGRYAVDPADPTWAEVEVVPRSGEWEGASAHATAVGRLWYGAGLGLTPHLASVDAYRSSHWLGEGFLRAGRPELGAPAIEPNRVQCHTWIGRLAPDASLGGAVDVLRRFDYAVARDGYVAVVSLDNGRESGIPDLLAHSYNAVVVGRADGDHSRGVTRFEGIGRSRPDLVGPLPATSLNVPLVGGAAGMLLELVDRDPALAAAGNGMAIKAILMAGASRDPFPHWANSPRRPLDPVVGAGLLDLYHSIQVLQFGRQPPAGPDPVPPIGWDVQALAEGDARHYVWAVPEGTHLEHVSILLHWQRIIRDTDPGPDFVPDADIADLTLTLWQVQARGRARQLAQSRSPVDNVECIALARLDPGYYVVEIGAEQGGTEYALAWHSLPMGEAPGR